MSMFKIAPHTVQPGRAAVEVYDADGKFVASIYADENASEIKIISKYIRNVVSAVEYDLTPPQTVTVRLNR